MSWWQHRLWGLLYLLQEIAGGHKQHCNSSELGTFLSEWSEYDSLMVTFHTHSWELSDTAAYQVRQYNILSDSSFPTTLTYLLSCPSSGLSSRFSIGPNTCWRSWKEGRELTRHRVQIKTISKNRDWTVRHRLYDFSHRVTQTIGKFST